MTCEPEPKKADGRAHHLPELLAEIAEVAGLAAALAVAQVRGGTRAHFPARCADDHWLVAAVGREAADKICRHFTVHIATSTTGLGLTVMVPLGPTKLYERARFRALAMLEAGHSGRETAREVGVSARSIENWVAAERKRKAVFRTGRATRAAPGSATLSRVYDPMKDGLVSSLQPPVADMASVASPSGNEPSMPVVDGTTLPLIIAEMAAVVGVAAAVVVASMKGCRALHITDHAGRGDELVRLAGPVSGPKLAAHFRAKHAGDVEILIPACPPRAVRAVVAWTAAACAAGHAVADVATLLGLTPAVVEHLCAAANATKGSGFSFRRDFPRFDPAEG